MGRLLKLLKLSSVPYTVCLFFKFLFVLIVSPSEPFGFLVSLGCIFLFKSRSLESRLAFLHSFAGLWTCAPHRGMTGQGPGNLLRTCQVLTLWVFSLVGDSFSRHVSSGVLAISMCVGDPLHHVVRGSLHSSSGGGSPSFFLWWGVPFIFHVVGEGPLHSSLSLPLPLAVPESPKYRAAQSPGSEPLGFFQVQGSTPGCYSSYTHLPVLCLQPPHHVPLEEAGD